MTTPKEPLQDAAAAAARAASTPPVDAVDAVDAAAGDGVAQAPPAGETVAVPAAPDELTEATRQRDEYLAFLQRERADFANYKRRVDEERAQQARDAAVPFIVRLLPILDDFERALASASPQDLEPAWAKGVQLIERNLRSLLAAEGVHRIEAQGVPFNPWEHEAIAYQPSAEAEEGTVVQVVRPGYRKGDRVIRPAQVIVAGQP